MTTTSSVSAALANAGLPHLIRKFDGVSYELFKSLLIQVGCCSWGTPCWRANVAFHGKGPGVQRSLARSG